MIDTVQIANPDDQSYPFSKALYEDATVVYHGTSSCYSKSIEAKGLVAGAPSFPVQAVQDLVSVCDTVGFRSWSYTSVKGLSIGTDLSRTNDRRVSLSSNFWFARDYATNTGGETISNGLLLSDELLEHLRTAPTFGELTEKVTAVRRLIAGLTANCFPIVYAVRIDPKWLEHEGKELHRRDLGDFVLTEVNTASRCSIPADRLLAKAEYTNGANPGYMGPQPRTWEKARRWMEI